MVERKRFNDILLKLLIVIVVFNGFLTNYLNIGDFRTGTLVCDAYLVLLVIYCVFIGPRYSKLKRSLRNVYTICFVMFFLVLLVGVLAYSSLYQTIAGIRNHVLYISVYMIVVCLLGGSDPQEIFRFLLVCMMMICGFAIAQYAFRSVLPEKLLIVQGATGFTIFGVSDYRCTGLVGDMLAMGSFANMTLVLLALYLYDSGQALRRYLWCLLPITAGILTFSRASIGLGCALIFMLVFLYFLQRRDKTALILMGATFIALFAVLLTPFGQRILLRFLPNETNIGSDAGRFGSYLAALNAIAGHPLLGLGFGTQMPSGTGGIRIVTDGHLWECLLEMGIPLFLAMLVFYLSTLLLSIRNRRKPPCRLYCAAFIILLVYYLIVSVFNSALDARSNMCILMILLGFVVSSVNNCEDPAPKPDYQ